MNNTHLTFRTIDTIDGILDGIAKLDPSRYMYAHLDILDALYELLTFRNSGEAQRLKNRLGSIREEIEAVLLP
jgi:hypothetical protein